MKFNIDNKTLVNQLEYSDLFELLIQWELTNPKHSFVNTDFNQKLKDSLECTKLSLLVNTNNFIETCISIYEDIGDNEQQELINKKALNGLYHLDVEKFRDIMLCNSNENNLYHFDNIQEQIIKTILNLE